MTQLQTTLAAVQELLIQQQQKIQELTQELAASKVPTSDSSPLEHCQFWRVHGFFCGHMESSCWGHNPAISSVFTWKTVFKPLVQIQVMAKHSYYLGSCFNDFGQLSVTGGPITTLLMTHSDPFSLTLDLTLAIKPSILTRLCCYMCK